MNARPEAGGAEVTASSRQSWGRLGAFGLLGVFGLLLATVISRSLPAPEPPAFDALPLVQLKRLSPEFVLLGNSMVGTRFDEGTMRRLLSPHRVSVIGVNGAKSAVWYLTIKNLLIASDCHPRVIQFFRDEELTEPRTFALTPRGRYMIARLSVGTEPVIERKLAPPLAEPIARLQWYRERGIPLERLREKTEPLLDRVAELASRLLWRKAQPATRKDEINELFSVGNLRAAEVIREPAAPDQAHVFKDVLEQSFLPDVCELVKDNHIPLTYVRVRTRAAASGKAQTPGERRYDADLERYVRACGAEFYDMRDATWESIDMYGSGDHIAGKFKRRYMELFVEHMGQIFH